MTLAEQIAEKLAERSLSLEEIREAFPKAHPEAIQTSIMKLKREGCAEISGGLWHRTKNKVDEPLVRAAPPPSSKPRPGPKPAPPPADGRKTCTRCAERKPLADFYPNSGRCKRCVYAVQKERRGPPKKRGRPRKSGGGVAP